MSERRIHTALISVYDKHGIEPIVRRLHELGVKLISTGGTQAFIKSLNLPVTAVEDITHFPEVFGGRVKTLHPKIFGGILARRELHEDLTQMEEHSIPGIDLVIVDLYPFEKTLKEHSGNFKKGEADIIEKIDIGGISLIRAAAKNFNDVLICASKDQYPDLLNILNTNKGLSTREERHLFATHAFNVTSHYDAAIFNYFNREKKVTAFKQSIIEYKALRYGENPHQTGAFYGNFLQLFDQLHGKEISHNNLVDIDAAVTLINEFQNPACAIIKHTNACGASEANDLLQAWEKALAADPVSAFGGIIIFNQEVSKEVTEKVNEIFFEIIIAPAYADEALSILKKKKNRIILIHKINEEEVSKKPYSFRSVLNGVIEQDKDNALSSEDTWKVVTQNHPDENQAEDLLFAEKCVKHLKSNAIVLVKNLQLIGMGCGQTSRVDALRQAIAKSKSFGFDLGGSVMASDAFFPFNDCVEIAHQEGIAATLQPGGSVRDQDSIDACNKYGIAMVFTGLRHFLH